MSKLWWLVGLLAALLAGAAWSVRAGLVDVPDEWNPWAPLRIGHPPTLLTRLKLARLSQDAAACRAVLGSSALRWQPLADREDAAGCGLHNAVRISATSVSVGPPFALSCRAAVSLALWEHHVLQPAAVQHLGSPVRRIEHLGSYACRNVYGRSEGRRSRHASADALDIAGFVLTDGRRVSLLRDWQAGGAPADFLREVGEGACRYFDGVLGPDYNAAHRHHFHFERSGFRMCR
ncbi:extensin family protein [Aquabacterium sp. A7-Y]|uniref:extensin-like domain-containing protein n=1 Tax=Aquabacterium sp. A7-Y TaxID=1349605 RepID=UPI00223D8195|nr:extensin family protein [Aquabacterium sp. A7-Y]MCW7540216.1 extensin family protein [Aquabacterium sp. A7-Y]